MTERPAPAVAVVLAGGSGLRMGASTPKQLLTLAGRRVVDHTLAAFGSAPGIDAILLVGHPDHLAPLRDVAAAHPRVTGTVAGGATRSDSTRAAIAALAHLPSDAKVLIHDGVRPLIDHAVIARVLAALDTYDAATAAIETVDTIIALDDDGAMAPAPPRVTLRRLQTPQGFRLGVLRAAYATSEATGEAPTDDCSVVLRHVPQVRVAVVAGSEENIKLTTPLDFAVGEVILRGRVTGSTLEWSE